MSVPSAGGKATGYPPDAVRSITPAAIALNIYRQHFADSIVMTSDGKILLQRRRDANAPTGKTINAFGGHVEPGETPLAAICRELSEELGAKVDAKDIIKLGCVTEALSDHQDLIYLYFWCDEDNSITGCYEHQPVYFDHPAEALAHQEIMPYAVWALHECQKHGYLPA